MNRQSLKAQLDRNNVDPYSYSLNGEMQTEQYVLEIAVGGWSVYYSERGQKTGAQFFATEDEACRALLALVLPDSTTRRPTDSR